MEQAKADTEDGMLYFHRLNSGGEIVKVFEGTWAYRFSHEDAKTSEHVELVANIVRIIEDWSEIWDQVDSGSKIKTTFELGESVKQLEEQGLCLFGLRTTSRFRLPKRDGTFVEQTAPVCNIHIAYVDSEKIIVLEPQEPA